MRTQLILVILFFAAYFNSFSQKENPLKYKGKIGNFSIEMKILKSDFKTGEFQGEYRYKGKEAFLKLNGTYYSPCLSMEESYKGKVTGKFFLELIGDSLIGKWVNESKVYDVKLKYQSGDTKLLNRQLPEDFASEVSSSIEGTYESHLYFINDYWSPEQTEIGYNGGKATIKIIDEKSIEINFETICGPTYHFAIGGGIAEKEGDEYIYRNEDGCEIKVSFSEKSVKMSANNSMDCGFGARAYLDHEFLKTSDQVQELSNY